MYSNRYIRAILKRWGTSRQKSRAWEYEFERGQWSTPDTVARPTISDTIEDLCGVNGTILDLGCADGVVGLTLDGNSYASYIGVDISEKGIADARAKNERVPAERRDKNRFFVSDIADFVPDRKANVVLFRQSLYYFNRKQIPIVLGHYVEHLADAGVFIVVMNNVKRHAWISAIIRESFRVQTETIEGDTIVLIFN